MFKQRLLTTLILVPLVLFIIYYGPFWLFTAVILCLLAGATFEGTALIPIANPWLKAGVLLAIIVLVPINYLYFNYFLSFSLACWCLLFIAILSFPASESIWGRPWLVTLIELIILPLFAVGLLKIYQQAEGKNLIVYLLALVWAVDIGAYLSGKKMGRHKLIPRVSPGKTIEGSLGGLVLAAIVSLGGFYLFKIYPSAAWFLMALLIVIVSMFGDLFISMLKRRVKLKDTGSLIPGHGGILDRLDSLIAATPFFCKGLTLLAGQ